MEVSTDYSLPDDLLDYLMKIYCYRSKFYALSSNIDGDIMSKYQLFTLDADMVFFLHKLQLGKDIETFSITIDYNEPLTTTNRQIADFMKCIAKTVKTNYDEIRTKNPHFDDYLQKGSKYLSYSAFILKDMVRNSRDSKIEIDFNRWDRYIQVYTLSRIDGLENKQIAYKMNFVDAKGTGSYTENEMIAAYNKTASDISHAAKLIEAAERGTFPYIVG